MRPHRLQAYASQWLKDKNDTTSGASAMPIQPCWHIGRIRAVMNDDGLVGPAEPTAGAGAGKRFQRSQLLIKPIFKSKVTSIACHQHLASSSTLTSF
jgi:hypothetical protein